MHVSAWTLTRFLSAGPQSDMKAKPRMAEDGKLWTPGAVDFFRTVNEQVGVVEEHAVGGLLLGTAQAASSARMAFQVRGRRGPCTTPCVRSAEALVRMRWSRAGGHRRLVVFRAEPEPYVCTRQCRVRVQPKPHVCTRQCRVSVRP